MDRPTVHANALEWEEVRSDARYGIRRKALGKLAGGQKLGCSLYELLPNRRSWPYHYHCANEEAYYVLEGQGALRLDNVERQIAAGDYVALPAGPHGGHQVINTSHAPLRYLAISTMIEPDIMVYPDSNKVNLVAGSAPGGDWSVRTLHKSLPLDGAVDYWKGEE
jgi:uncharacterized cupin superfamily protein